ncbi:MAG: alpha/beta hydrolase [Pseudomonadota bacterium]
MPVAEVNGISLFYEESGQGEPLLMIPGLGMEHREYSWLAAGLEPHCRILAFDNRGAGQSDKPKGPYSVEMLADDAAGLLDVLGAGRTSVFGISFGAKIAQMLALRRPDLVDRLILGCSYFSGAIEKVKMPPESFQAMKGPGGTREEVARRVFSIALSERFVLERPEVFEQLVRWRIERPIIYRGYFGQLKAILAFDIEDRVGTISNDTLILHGSEDRIVPVQRAHDLHAALRNSTVEILEGAGHLFFIEQPERTAGLMVDFLASSSSS